jgi:hypothetical protein
MTTRISHIITKHQPNGTLEIPFEAWRVLAKKLFLSFDAEFTVHDCPAEPHRDGSMRPPFYWLVAAIPGDARDKALGVMGLMDRETDKLIAKYTHTNIPLGH